MQVTKIYCDCCGNEFTKTRRDTFSDVDVNVMTGDYEKAATSLDKEKRIINQFKSSDVCGVCAVKILEFINQLKDKKCE